MSCEEKARSCVARAPHVTSVLEVNRGHRSLSRNRVTNHGQGESVNMTFAYPCTHPACGYASAGER